MRRGEVIWANLRPRSCSEQRGTRPVVVVSHDGFNEARGWRSVTVVPLTTSGRQARRGPTAVEVRAGEAGLDRTSFALCHQITTLDRAKLGEALGQLTDGTLARVDEGIRAALDLG